MKKLLTVLASSLLSCSAMAASISLTEVGPGQFAASFSGSAAAESFTLDLTGFAASVNVATSLLTANSLLGQGYDISGATFDGLSFTPVVNTTIPGFASVDYWSYGSALASPTVHTLVVNGSSFGGGSYTGSLSLTVSAIAPPPVPEPETFAMMLAGLGALAFLARRRQRG